VDSRRADAAAGPVAEPAAGPDLGLRPVAAVSDVPPGALLSVRGPDGEQIVLINSDGEICALLDRCSHEEYPLSAGEVMPDGTIECVWHGARFDCRTGAVRGLPAVEDVPAYAVSVQGGTIYLGPRLAPP
jgi:3-phenylpropionate/trans-cinnamate dioxygenase ferredoxin subunit